MKHYLELVSFSAKRRRRQSRMTKICIVLSVFLVSTIFGMADMQIKNERNQSIQMDGAWHAVFRNMTDETAEMIAARPEVVKSGRYEAINYTVDQGYTIGGRETVICGMDESMLDLYPSLEIIEGEFPKEKDQAVITRNAQEQMGIKVGDTLTMETQEGPLSFSVSGISGDTSSLISLDVYGLFLDIDTYREHFKDNTLSKDAELYVKFTKFCDIQETINDICSRLNIDPSSVGQNTRLLALMLQSDDPYMIQLYTAAGVLAVLVMVAGILMISSSLNSNVAQRIRFFGMLRCLGSTRRQVVKFVRREALLWCRTAIPLGVAGSILIVWLLCALLRWMTPTFFYGMPALGISVPGILAGAVLGLVTVLLAVRTPAKKASRVSPLTAVSGNSEALPAARRAARTRFFPVEAALGFHHAAGSKKNFFLMSGSFAFSMILFLAFSTVVDFMHHSLVPLRPYTPDVSVVSEDNTCSIAPSLLEEVKELPEVKRAFGRSFAYNLPVRINGKEAEVNLISYEENQFGWAEDMLGEGNISEAEEGKGVLLETGEGKNFAPGDKITMDTPQGTREVTVTGTLSYTPFSRTDGVETVICSEELFRELTGEEGYTILDMQLTKAASDEDVDKIRKMAGEDVSFSDQRLKNSEARGAYYSFAVFVYGFLAVIALISVFNIINSIAMSVSARMHQYGAMRAIGMSGRQLVRMVAFEAGAYVGWGIVFGCGAGLPLNWLLYRSLVTSRYGSPWQIPTGALLIICSVLFFSVILAVYAPAKRIRQMSIVDTINEQ